MALTPTDRDEHFFKAMVDAADGSTPEELQPTERREHWYKEIIDAIAAAGGGSGGVPPVEDADKGKYLHANESTGDLEWATAGGSGGGALVVHLGDGNALDKTWAEIDAADVASIVSTMSSDSGTAHIREFVYGTVLYDGDYIVEASGVGRSTYVTDSADGYPVRQRNQ